MHDFWAKTKSEPQRIFHIWSHKYKKNGIEMNDLIWCVSIAEVDRNNEEQPVWDTVDETLSRILHYPTRYTDETLEWFDASNQKVDMEKLIVELDC